LSIVIVFIIDKKEAVQLPPHQMSHYFIFCDT
jgi:hypothetical protein